MPAERPFFEYLKAVLLPDVTVLVLETPSKGLKRAIGIV